MCIETVEFIKYEAGWLIRIVCRMREVNIKEELFALQDISYADFQAELTPNIARDLFL